MPLKPPLLYPKHQTFSVVAIKSKVGARNPEAPNRLNRHHRGRREERPGRELRRRWTRRRVLGRWFEETEAWLGPARETGERLPALSFILYLAHKTWVVTVRMKPGKTRITATSGPPAVMPASAPSPSRNRIITRIAPVISIDHARALMGRLVCQGERIISIAHTGQSTKGKAKGQPKKNDGIKNQFW